MYGNERRKVSRYNTAKKSPKTSQQRMAISLSPENQVTLLEVNSQLDFEAHIHKMCKKLSKELNAFLRIAGHLNVAQKKY